MTMGSSNSPSLQGIPEFFLILYCSSCNSSLISPRSWSSNRKSINESCKIAYSLIPWTKLGNFFCQKLSVRSLWSSPPVELPGLGDDPSKFSSLLTPITNKVEISRPNERRANTNGNENNILWESTWKAYLKLNSSLTSLVPFSRWKNGDSESCPGAVKCEAPIEISF